MKKLLGVFLGVMMVFGVAGKASAAFDLGNMSLVAYEEADNTMPIGSAGNEVHYDLGPASESYVDLSVGSFTVDTGITLDNFDATSWDDIYVGIFGGSMKPDYSRTDVVFASDENDFTIVNPSAFQSTTYSYWEGNRSATPLLNGNISMAKGTFNSYWDTMLLDGTNPSYGTLLNIVDGEAQLSDGLVTMDMYTTAYNGSGYDFDLIGHLTLDTSSGSLVMCYNPVPVPASVFLLGSGLLGLFGIRRRKA